MHQSFGKSVTMTDDGIVIGHGTVLVRMAKGASAGLALEADRDRFDALMSVAIGRPIAMDAFRHVEAVDRHWQSGEKALANLRLIFADLPCLSAPADSWRLTLAEHLIDNGMKPNDLLAELGVAVDPVGLEKYSPDQPRVPAGHGRESGRFDSRGGSQVSVALLAPVGLAAAPAVPIAAASSLAGPIAFIAAMLIPTPNSGGVDEGTLPDMPDVHFRRDGPAGTLELTARDADGTNVTVLAHNQAGAYVDARTGREIGRDLGSSISLDQAAVSDAIDDTVAAQRHEEPEHQPKAATDEPEVCPAPEKDKGHGAKPRSLDYEDDVHARVNPINPIKRGDAVRVWDPGALKFIYVDDCFRSHGDLVDGDMRPGDLADAKGPGYERLLSQSFGGDTMNGLVYDAERQLRAAEARGVQLKWYFAERGAADFVRERFRDNRKLNKIVISHMPPRMGDR